MAAPLNQLLKADQKFQWSDTCQHAFQDLKQALTDHPVLVFPNFQKEFLLYTDASDTAVGYILGQLDDDGKERVVAYGGRSMNTSERKWGITDKEGLALIEGIKHFQVYLTGKHFTVLTDHTALKSLRHLTKQQAPRRMRWSDFLQGFDFSIVHKPGRVHNNADALSRRRYPDSSDTSEPEPNVFPLVSPINSQSNPTVEYNISYVHNAEGFISKEDSQDTVSRLMSSEESYDVISAVQLTSELCHSTSDDLRHKQLQDPQLGSMMQFMEQQILPEDEKLALEIRRTYQDYELDNGILFYRYVPPGKGTRSQRLIRQLMVPHVLRSDLLKSYHDSLLGSHQGFNRTYERLKKKYWWHSMSKDTKTYIESCDVCQKSKRHFHAHRAPLHPLPIVDTFHRVHMDFLGPLPTSSAGHKHILLIVDSFSKWPEAFPLKTTDAATVARVFYDQYICRYGAPKSILTDRGQNFMSNLLKELCEIFQITKISTSSYHPQTNSTCERMNSYILQGLRAHCNSDQTNWHEVLQSIMLAYRTTPATQSTKHSPYMLLFGRECQLPIDVALSGESEPLTSRNEHLQKIIDNVKVTSAEAKANLAQAQTKSKTYYDKQASCTTYKIGDHVYLSNHKHKKGLSPKLTQKWTGPYYIVKTFPNDTYHLRACGTDTAVRNRVHSNRLKKCVDPDVRPTNTKPGDVLSNDKAETAHHHQPEQHPEEDNLAQNDNDSADSDEAADEAALTHLVQQIYRCTRDNKANRWYFVKLKNRPPRFLRDYLVPQKMREQFHIAKTMKGKAKKSPSHKENN